MSNPIAAWYQDPRDPSLLRWWDGTRWTEHTAPAGVARATPAVRARATPARKRHKRTQTPARSPRVRLTWWQIALIIVGVMVAGGVLAQISPVLVGLAFLATVVVGVVVLAKGSMPLPGFRSRRSGFAALGTAFLLVLGGGVGAAGTQGPQVSSTASDSPRALLDTSDRSPSPTPTRTSARPTPSPKPTTFETVEVSTEIAYEQTSQDDPNLDQGQTALAQAGAVGALVTTYEVTLVDGVEKSREVVSEVIAVEATPEITSHGTRLPVIEQPRAAVELPPQGDCHPSYEGVCVPYASDVDCAGGSGDGPAYVSGPVRVVGPDVYKLDRDGDGFAC